MSYISGIDKQEQGCIFCAKPAESDDRDNLILTRGAHAFIILNRYPYTNGHLMVVPYRHTAAIEDLDDDVMADMWRLCRQSVAALREVFHPEGFNIGLNAGRVAGAGIDQHLHLHVVPRWNGDVNFMPVLAETRVISQSLRESYDTLKPHYHSVG